MSISNYLENKILDKVFNNVDFSVVDNYISLHTSNPGETGGGEASGRGYTRQQATFTIAFGGTVTLNEEIVFLNLPSGSYSYVGLWDTSSYGNYLWGGSLLEEKLLSDGEGIVIYSGGLIVDLD